MKIYNDLTLREEEFIPQEDKKVKMYVCGVTPYDESHLGHAMSYIVFDVVRRYLKFRGYDVKYVQNITDIDDKIINRANKLGISTSELAEKYAASFFDDMQALNVLPADVNPRATQEIPMIIKITQGLVDKSCAYPARGSVYFRVRSLEDYGKLSHRDLDQMKAGARVEPGEEKEDPMDFVLWKASKPGEPSWESPWGPGRPGWHIECSAMSMRYLGEQIDIHGGGQDLVFPHHENEIAQSESYTCKKPFVRYWMHNGFVQVGADKMSKSLGNFVTIKQILGRYSADAIRLFILSSHYRSPLTFTTDVMDAAERGADRLRQTANSIMRGTKKGELVDSEGCRNRFIEAMDNDFNTPQALAVIFDMAHGINRLDAEGCDTTKARKAFAELTGILGLTLKEVGCEQPLDKNAILEAYSAIIAEIGSLVDSPELSVSQDISDFVLHRLVDAKPEDMLNSLIQLRKNLRSVKQFKYADFVRNELDKSGILLEDTPKGTVWKRKK